MYVQADLLLRSMYDELAPLLGADHGEASPRQGIVAAITLLRTHVSGGTSLLSERLDSLAAVLDHLRPLPTSDALWTADIDRLQVDIAGARAAVASMSHDRCWANLLVTFEGLTSRLLAAPAMPPGLRANVALTLGAWEVADRRRLISRAPGTAPAMDTRITHEKLQSYLRLRFGEPGMHLTAFNQLSGGFGKETFLLEVTGDALQGGLVLRRDPLVPTIDNDCHRVSNEYQVVREAFRNGFPAPDALWLETWHDLLPGGDFMVMRRAAGSTGGNVFGATETLSANLIEVLATSMARLHTLPPCIDLGDLTESIRTASWGMSLQDSIYHYVRGWFDLYMREVHNSSPTLAALFGFLLDNVPVSDGAPALLHGDIGFHNMLIDNGRLTALVDWEFAHVGDPAEDVGAARNTSRNDDWINFMRHYRAAGGPDFSPERLHFFRIWQHVRNAAASNLSMGRFSSGAITDLKLAYTGHFHFPLFIQAACDLLAAGPGSDVRDVDY